MLYLEVRKAKKTAAYPIAAHTYHEKYAHLCKRDGTSFYSRTPDPTTASMLDSMWIDLDAHSFTDAPSTGGAASGAMNASDRA